MTDARRVTTPLLSPAERQQARERTYEPRATVVTPSQIINAARVSDGSLQCSRDGVRSPTHLRELVAQVEAEREAYIARLEQRLEDLEDARCDL